MITHRLSNKYLLHHRVCRERHGITMFLRFGSVIDLRANLW